jgi:hypothetical protein
LLLDSCQSIGQLGIGYRRPGPAGRQPWIVTPPVQADLLGLVDRADQEADLDREELDVREVDLDIARDHQAFVEDAVEDLDQPVAPRRRNEF